MKVQISRQSSAEIAAQFAADNLLENVTVDAQEVKEVIVPETDTSTQSATSANETQTETSASTDTPADTSEAGAD